MATYQARHGPAPRHHLARAARVGAAVAVAALAVVVAPMTTAQGAPSQSCVNQSPNPTPGNGANVGGAYDPSCDGSDSQNGNGGGNGNGNGPPCAGCVGNADGKNPPGQAPDGGDPNAGYECDTNNGVGKGNPAHSGCTPRPSPSPSISLSQRSSSSATPSIDGSTPPASPPVVLPTQAVGPPNVVPPGVVPPRNAQLEGAEVLGVKIVAPAPAAAPAEVAPLVLPLRLPHTGPVSEQALSLGIALLGVGALMEYAGRRRLRAV